MAPPKIQTYHCICTSLLLSSTHTLSHLPRRSSSSSSTTSSSLPYEEEGSLSDRSIILPLPSKPPHSMPGGSGPEPSEDVDALPAEGYTVLLGLLPDRKVTIVRREDGFEKRILYRCVRCRLVVGYELQNPAISATDTNMDIDSDDKGKEREEGAGGSYEGKILYILPGGVMSTEVMSSGRKIAEGEVGFVGTGTGGGRGGGVGVFE